MSSKNNIALKRLENELAEGKKHAPLHKKRHSKPYEKRVDQVAFGPEHTLLSR